MNQTQSLILILILSVFHNTFGQDKILTYFDSAKANTYDTTLAFQYLDSVRLLSSDDKRLLQADVLKGDILNKNVAFKASKIILYQSYLKSIAIGSDSLIAKSAFLFSIPLFNEGLLDSAILFLKSANTNSIKAGDSLIQGMSLNNLGFAFENRGDLDSALINYQKSSNILIGLRNFDQAAHAKMNMGYISQTQENLELAKAYFFEAKRLAETGKGIHVLVYTNLALGNLYCQEDLEDSCFYYLKKAEDLVGEKNMPDMNQYIFSYLGDAYKQFHRYVQAKEYYQKSFEIYELAGDSLGIMGIKENLGEISFEQGDYHQAIIELKSAKKMAVQIRDRASISKINQKMADSYVSLGDWEQAVSHLNETLEVQEELYSQQRLEALQELQTKYETEKKDNEIASLSQQSQIQALMISQRNTQLMGAGLVLIFLVIGGFVFYNQRKLRHQQAVSDMEQRMLRLQMNPHFIFNALASIQSYILQSDTKESVSYLAKFGKLMRQILEHSREESISVAEEVDMLKNYIEIQQLRFKGRFDYQIEVDTEIDLEQTKIPPLFAQPFVENAIEHGLKNESANGLVTVRFKQSDSQLLLEVEDNGSGLVEEKMVNEHKSLATTISRERLDILGKRFKQRFDLSVENSRETNGVKARVTLPVFS